jgi:hypothetical protein
MTRLLSEGEIIQPNLDSEGRLFSFTWHGRRYTIGQVVQSWEIDREWWSELGHISREYYAVTTRKGMLCVVYRVLLNNAWHIERIYD